MAAEASEAAAGQGAFWQMNDLLLHHQDALSADDLTEYARELDLDTERFWDDLRRRRYADRVGEDVASADASGVAGTPTFFINGRRHQGAYDIETLTNAVTRARSTALLRGRGQAEPEPAGRA
jgi:protein-disulfide isomerase